MMIGHMLGPYRVLDRLGEGGMGEVYKARDTRLDRDVAVKVLRPELSAVLGTERFLREIRLTAGLQHPHILPLLDSGEGAGLFFYVMPYVEGESLRQKLNREHQLSIEEAVRLATEVAEALEYAHGLGIIHRDIKPENILLSRSHALVADFGIALAVHAAGGVRLTQTGLALGTPAYMSPEQAEGGEIDGRSDQYSLACVLYETLAGEPPHTGPSAHAILAKRLNDPVPRVSLVRASVPANADSVIRKALARAPADRFTTMREFADALAGKPRQQSVEATRGEPLRESPRASLPATLLALIARSRLTMTSGISYLVCRTSDEIVRTVSDAAKHFPRDSDAVFYINQGGGEITIICDADHEHLVAGLRYQAFDYRRPVGVLRIRETQDDSVPRSVEVPGYYAYFLGQLADNGINILDVISAGRELALVLVEADLTPAFALLTDRIRECRRQTGV